MSKNPAHDERRLYTAQQVASLPTDRSHRYELSRGVVTVSPRPIPPHSSVLHDLYSQIRPQLRSDLRVYGEIDVDLELTPPVVRVPDLCVTSADAWTGKGMVKADALFVAVEILSPGSRTMDSLLKALDYAEAGIPQYWLVDPELPVTMTVYTLVDGHYEESQRAEHKLIVTDPCPLSIDLDTLGT
ncbi:Uma2 family endonuclease [Actinokineospora iranica]|uniref:Endonuclease, Uma2 family (Restriction endonuclease fold) n=1 Tax=Actinokineospora iranica TaxID=1271860 RepID=A0A1G6R2K7_9PSEU|nr:Uma2 family endonuclease [Actinokineospora iranica]SDC98484.1 Endonuclease, Uma2 family (restriction endonuclease fold) [Actinokineospora iranica]